MKHKDLPSGKPSWFRRNCWSLLVLLLAALLFAGFRLALREGAADQTRPGDYAEYERGAVASILTDNCFSDPGSDGGWRGEQMLLVDVKTGQYAGEQLLVYNYVGPLSGVPVQEGDSVALIISTYSNGDHRATVFEYDRSVPLLLVVLLFFAVTVLVGRGTGAKSLIALVITIAALFYILFPLLIRGYPTLPTVFLVCVYIAVVSFTILGGIRRKSVCAMLGTVAGMTFAMLFGLLAQYLCRVSGLRVSDVEPLLQLRQTGTPIGLRGLLVAGVVVSSLGAVMDVAMSIASALEEVHAANGELGFRALFRSGMNIGQDMVGTMTNTLILAILGSGFTTILYLYSLGLARYQLFPSAYLSIEVISGIASSIGMILAIPLTAAVSSLLIERKKAPAPADAPQMAKAPKK